VYFVVGVCDCVFQEGCGGRGALIGYLFGEGVGHGVLMRLRFPLHISLMFNFISCWSDLATRATCSVSAVYEQYKTGGYNI